MLHFIALIFFILALYLLVTGIYYKKLGMFYNSTPIKASGKIVKEILGEVGMKYYSIFASVLFFIISIFFVYSGLKSQDREAIDSYFSRFKIKSTQEIAREKAIKDGKSEFSYVSDGITITEILKEDPNTSKLTIDEVLLIISKDIDQVICLEIKKITKSPFKEIEVKKDKKNSSEINFEQIQVSNISDSIKKDIIKFLIKNEYKEGLKDNWINKKVNINFTKCEKDNILLINKL